MSDPGTLRTYATAPPRRGRMSLPAPARPVVGMLLMFPGDGLAHCVRCAQAGLRLTGVRPPVRRHTLNALRRWWGGVLGIGEARTGTSVIVA